MQRVMGSDAVWRDVCSRLGYAQKSATRTRGAKPWRTVYTANLCVECVHEGKIVLNLSGGSTETSQFVSLCSPCFGTVAKRPMHLRTHDLLPRVKSKHGALFQFKLYNLVPEPKCCRPPSPIPSSPSPPLSPCSAARGKSPPVLVGATVAFEHSSALIRPFPSREWWTQEAEMPKGWVASTCCGGKRRRGRRGAG